MATRLHNISGELTQELLAAGDNVRVSSISLAKVEGTYACSVDLWIEKKLTGTFYLFKTLSVPASATIIYEDIKFNNNSNEFGLYIKLTKSASETPTVDVVIN